MNADIASKEADKIDPLLIEFIEGLDSTERAVFLHTATMMKQAKTKAVATRRWLDFERWHCDRHGIPHRIPKRVRKPVAKKLAEV